MSAAVPYWWAIGLLAIALWELTWKMSGTDKAQLLSLERVDGTSIRWANLAAIALFSLFLGLCEVLGICPSMEKWPAGKVLWSVLILSDSEELFFRGLMY